MLWCILINGIESGPCTAAELRTMYEMGTLQPSSYIRKQNSPRWHKVEDVRGLLKTDTKIFLPRTARLLAAHLRAARAALLQAKLQETQDFIQKHGGTQQTTQLLEEIQTIDIPETLIILRALQSWPE